MPAEELRSAYWKLSRADEHLAQLKASVNELTPNPNRYREFVEYDPHEGCHILWIDDIPFDEGKRAALILGDFVHCARGALDHAVWRLAVQRLRRWPTREEAKEIQFPIRSVTSFASSPVLKYISSAAGNEIAQFQLPKRADECELPLALLATLSNHDKHRTLTPTHHRTTLRRQFEMPSGVRLIKSEHLIADEQIAWLVRHGYLKPIEGGETLIGTGKGSGRVFADQRLYFEPEDEARTTEIKSHPEITLDVAFHGPHGPLAPEDFEAIMEKAREIVGRLDRLF